MFTLPAASQWEALLKMLCLPFSPLVHPWSTGAERSFHSKDATFFTEYHIMLFGGMLTVSKSK